MIKIKSIKFYNHDLFGNKTFDFSFDDGSIPNNIIIAGKNGVGKTKLLEEIDQMLSGFHYLTPFDIYNNICDLELELIDEDYYDLESNERINKVILYNCKNQEEYRYYAHAFYNNKITSNIKKENDEKDVNYFNFNSIYSSVDINYKPREMIQSVTNKILDEEYVSKPVDIAQEIIQLLVDISSRDNNDLAKWVKLNKKKKVPEQMIDKRMKRFTNAFTYIFDDNIIYEGIKENTIPVFRKNNKEIEITELSSGEKQIIFRGTYLLRNKNSLAGSPIIVDEPEISMHPLWEDKIFGYYNSLFVENKKQSSQIFIASHSEHILKSALNRKDSIVIKMDIDGYKKYSKKSKGIILPTISIAEIKFLIFDIYTIDFHNLLFGYIQENLAKGKDEASVLDTDKWLLTKNVTKKKYYYKKYDITYNSLQTYVRNCIDHPTTKYKYKDEELQKSIKEMLDIIKDEK